METNKVEIKKTEIKRMEPDLKLINMETVEVEQIEWLFYPFIPFGKVTIIQGDPGEGKTTMVLQIIAKLTKGEEILPRQENTAEVKDGAETAADSDVKLSENPMEPVNVIYQTAEDGLGDTIKPRLLAAGADCSRVLVIDDREQPLTMLDIRLEEAIVQTKARLVVLDPIQGLFDVCRQYGLDIEEVPEYGGKKYLEKQEFIIQAQKEKIARQEQMIKEQEEKIMDNETLIDEVSEIAYDKAVEVVTEKVRAQTQEEDIRLLDQLCNNIVKNPNNSDKAKTITKNVIKMAKDKLRNTAKTVIDKVQKNLQEPEVRKANTEQIKKKARTSVLEKLAANKKRVAEENATRRKTKTKYHDRDFL